MNYGDAINWCIQNDAVFRFVKRRSAFIELNASIPGDKALELAYMNPEGKTVAVHAPLDSSTEPSKAVARTLIACVQSLAESRSAALTGAAAN